jgi:hypothetical protein
MSETQKEVVQLDTDAATTAADSKVVVIEVANPTSEEATQLAHDIKVNFDFDVNVKPVMFNFKKSKDKDTNIETVRKPVQLAVPYPSVQGVMAILEAGGKGLELLLEAMENVVNTNAREILYEDVTLTAASFPVDKLAWEFIANIPKVQRRGGGIPKDTWDAFCQDYCEVMPAAAGKTPEQCANAAKILGQKLQPVKTNEAVIQLLVQQLAIYAEATPNLEEFSDCVEFLLAKAEAFMNVSEEELLANL